MSELRAAERRLRDAGDLNHRQLALLGHALRHPDAAYTIASHRASHGTVYDTARKDLLDLERRGFLQSKRRGKAFYFYPAPTLRERVSEPQ